MNKRIKLLLLALIVGFCFVLGDISSIFAQETDTEEFTLEEITVTAQKREENQQKVAIAMDVISAEDIREQGKNDLNEILTGVSSALIQKATDGLRVSIRGMADDSSASSSGQSTAVPTVAINTDGVYSNSRDGSSGLYDIERVEVLYGPQSTMYSSNSPGGIINIITAQPKTDKFSVSGSLELGSYNLVHTEGAVNIPLSERFAVRTSFSTSKRDGYLSDGTDNENTKSARIRGLFQANDRLSFTLTGEIAKNTGAGFGNGVARFADQDDVDDPWTSAQSGGGSSSDKTTKKVSGQMSLDSSFGAMTLIPSYSKGEGTRGFRQGVDIIDSTQESKEKGVELRMTSPSDFYWNLKWIIGGTYYKSEDRSYYFSDEYLADPSSGEYSDRMMTNNNKAVYANITYPLWFHDKLRLTLGYRQSWDEMISDNKENKPDPIDNTVMAAMDQYEINSNEGEPDWKYGFEYDVAENFMLYGDYSSSYRVQGMGMGGGGGPGGGGPPPSSFNSYAQSFIVPAQSSSGSSDDESEPTRLKSYSLGAKSRFFGNKLQVNTSAYYYDYKNYQANQMISIWFDAQTDGTVAPETDNNSVQDSGESTNEPNAAGTGDGRIYGFDLQTSAIITSKDMVTFSVSYMKSEWTTLDFDYTYSWTYRLDDNGVRYRYYIGDGDYNGLQMMSTPPWTVNLNYTHNFTLWNGGNIRAGITAKYQTGYSLSWYKDDYPYNYQETFHTESVNGTYSHPDGKWTLSAYVNNIFNYAEKTMYMNAGGTGQLSIGNPRTYGAVFSVKF